MKNPTFVFNSPAKEKLTLFFPIKLALACNDHALNQPDAEKLRRLIRSHKEATCLMEKVNVIQVLLGSDQAMIDAMRQSLDIHILETTPVELDRLAAKGYIHPLNDEIIAKSLAIA